MIAQKLYLTKDNCFTAAQGAMGLKTSRQNFTADEMYCAPDSLGGLSI